MYSKKFVLKYCAILFFVLLHINYASPQSLNELKQKITSTYFPHYLLDDYEFYLFNNKVNSKDEIKYLSHLKSSFETEYLISIILYRNNDFDNSFSKLSKQLKNSPERYSYYDLLSKTGHILDKNIDADLIGSKKYKNYLKAKSEYENGNYKEAKDLFNAVLKIDSTAFEPNFMLAYTYRNLGKYNTALKYFNKSIKTEAKDSPHSAKVRIAIGSLFFLAGNYEKAKTLYNSGLDVASKIGYNSEKIKAILNIGMLLDIEGKTKKAREKFDEAINLANSIDDKELGATVLSEYAVSYTYTGEEVKARNKYHESFLLLKKLRNKKRLALTAINIGNSYLNISNYKSAIEYFNIGLEYVGDNVRSKMMALRGLGDVYTNLANYTKALEYYDKSKKMAKELDDIIAESKINIGLGVLYYNLQMPNKSLEFLKESEKSLTASENPYLKIELQQKIGIIYSLLDSLQQASEYLENAANLSEKYGYIYSKISSNTFLTKTKIKQNRLSDASSLLYKTIAQAKSVGYKQILGKQYLYLSKIDALNSDKIKEIEHINNALIFAESSNDFSTLINANYRLGSIYKASGDFNKAKKYLNKAISIVENNFNILFSNADIQIKFFSNYYPVYNSLISIYLSENKFVEAFELLESSKGKNTNLNLTNIRIGKLEKEYLNEYYDLKWRIKKGLYGTDKLQSIITKLKKIENRIAYKTENHHSHSVSKIQSNLNENEYLVSYFLQNKIAYAFVLSSKELQVKELNISVSELSHLKETISPYYNSRINKNEISFNKDLFAFNAVGANRFFNRIVKPVIKNIPENSKLIFSLPSELVDIPFELMVTNDNDNLSPYLLDKINFLVDDYSIYYTPSAVIWSKLKSKKNANKENALLIGDPFFNSRNIMIAKERGLTDEIDFATRNIMHLRLEYSKDEIKSIASLINNETTYLSENATETNFKKNVENASIVHLSTHSFLYKNNPLIIFSNNDIENDGFLEVGEILNLNLNSDLVVLSSCKSGLGNIDRAEGIVGMQKAFFDAGAKSVVVSLWDVNDKYTSIFMKYFYSFLSKNISKSEALRLAKIKFIKEDSSNPYYWAAFTLSGSDLPLKTADVNHNEIFIFLVLLLSLVGTLFIFTKYSGKHFLLFNPK